MTEYVHGDLTQRIIGAAMEVHRNLGPGFVEAVYEDALAHEFELQGIQFQRQLRIPVYYKGIQVGRHRLDLLVEGKVVIELKSAAALTDVHYAFILSYLAATKLQIGLLLNFAKPSLEIKRVAHRDLPR